MYADTVLFNGMIHTQFDRMPKVTALAIRDDRIVALGSDEAMLTLLKPRGAAINLDGKTVIPGLTDAHVHLSWYADFLHHADLTAATSAQHAAQLVADQAQDSPPGEWVRGRGWAQDDWPDRAFPTAAILDELLPDNPVYLPARSGHAAWVNTPALKAANVMATTEDPPGGQIMRDEAGQPTGVLLETAMKLVSQVIPSPSPEQVAEQVKVAIQRAHRNGLTGVHDFDWDLALRAFQLLKERGDLSLRIVKMINVPQLDWAVDLGLRFGFGDDLLRLGQIKTFADGALGPRTAWMIEPYENEVDNFGICTADPEEMLHNVSRASAAGFPSTIHAIGDRAVREVLRIYEAVRQEEAARGLQPSDRRHRIEHVQVIHPDDGPRLGQLGVIASMQPIHATSDMIMADDYWGDRAAYAYNWRLQVDAGATLALGSDAPIEAIEPLPNIQAAVTRRRPDGSPGPRGWRNQNKEALSVSEALHGFTVGAAYAAGMEDRLGRLAPGYLADLVVLEQDILTINPMEIGATAVEGTMIGGEWVYRHFDG
ncbi:MAG: amidohydrolase family protein [Chloroflexi bacterium]|nr:amidohydrolase family protein [Chloroflexota bacterium]